MRNSPWLIFCTEHECFSDFLEKIQHIGFSATQWINVVLTRPIADNLSDEAKDFELSEKTPVTLKDTSLHLRNNPWLTRAI